MANRTIPTLSPVTGSSFISAVAEKIALLFNSIVLIPTVITNSGNDYTLTVDPVLDGDVVPGMAFMITPNVNNSGAVRLRVTSGNPYYNLNKIDGTPFASNEFTTTNVYHCVFTGAGFVAVNVQGSASDTVFRDPEIFTASGTWNKPSGINPNALMLVQIWGGGGAGSSAGTTSSGGGGGAHNYAIFRMDDLASSESITIGAGGASVGTPGGNTSFGSIITAYGGEEGEFGSSTSSEGGGGGGQLSAGGVGRGGYPSGGHLTGTANVGKNGNAGAGGYLSAGSDFQVGGDGIFGGGGGGHGNGVNGGDGGRSLWGGGGGAGGTGSQVGGTSVFGGNGGNVGVAGQAPGGGGGSGALGARGEARIYYL